MAFDLHFPHLYGDMVNHRSTVLNLLSRPYFLPSLILTCVLSPYLQIGLLSNFEVVLTFSNPIFLPTAYFPALICFGWERGWKITCNYPTVLNEKNMEKQKVVQPALSVG
jgi:hypothetical protein